SRVSLLYCDAQS
ncbi:feS assembly ATPase SufC, partial [Chlamydia suis MD56]